MRKNSAFGSMNADGVFRPLATDSPSSWEAVKKRPAPIRSLQLAKPIATRTALFSATCGEQTTSFVDKVL